MSRDLSFMAVNKYLSVVNISSGFFTLNGDVVCWFGGGGNNTSGVWRGKIYAEWYSWKFSTSWILGAGKIKLLLVIYFELFGGCIW